MFVKLTVPIAVLRARVADTVGESGGGDRGRADS